MPKDTKTLGNSKARACESLGFEHKKRLCQSFDTTSLHLFIYELKLCITRCTRERYHITNIRHTRHEQKQTLKAQTKT